MTRRRRRTRRRRSSAGGARLQSRVFGATEKIAPLEWRAPSSEDPRRQARRHRRTQLLALLYKGRLPRALADQRLLHRAPAQAGGDRLDATARAGAVAAGADIERVGQALSLLQAGIVAA